MCRTITYLFAMHKATCRHVLTQRAILLRECLLLHQTRLMRDSLILSLLHSLSASLNPTSPVRETHAKSFSAR